MRLDFSSEIRIVICPKSAAMILAILRILGVL